MPETYATLAEVLAAWPDLGKRTPEAQQQLVDDANAAVADVLQREILLAERVEAHDGRNRSRLHLRVTPVSSVDAVEVDGRELDPDDGRAWTFNPRTGALVRGDGRGDPRFAKWWPRGTQNVRVTYTAGHDPVPRPVRRAVVLVAKALDASTTAVGPYKSESLGDWSYTLADGSPAVPDAAWDLLRDYIAPGA